MDEPYSRAQAFIFVSFDHSCHALRFAYLFNSVHVQFVGLVVVCCGSHNVYVVEPGQALAYKLRRPEGHGQSRLFESTPTQLNLTANPFSNRTVKATDELSPYPQGDGTLNSATASIRPSPQAELRAHIVTGSIAAVTATIAGSICASCAKAVPKTLV